MEIIRENNGEKHRPLSLAKKVGKRKKTQEQVIEECKEITKGCNYSFGHLNYQGALKNITITCHEVDELTGKEHGDFDIRVDSLLRGHRCPRCNGKLLSLDEFLDHAKLIHGDGRYDYSLVNEYHGNSSDYGEFICHRKNELGVEHGIFRQTFYGHLHGRGCPKCSGSVEINKDIFVKRAREIHGDRYSYDNFDYKKMDIKGWITCPIHGDFEQTPATHLKGSGCPYCKNSKMEESLSLLFDSNSIYYETQVRRKELGSMSLDFYLPQKHLCIECQGTQHYMPSKFDSNMSDEDAVIYYNDVVDRDKKKYNIVTNSGDIMVYYVEFSRLFGEEINPYGGWYEDKVVFTSKLELLKYMDSLPNYDYIPKEKAIRRKKIGKKRIKWTYEKCKEEAKKYKNRTEFQQKCQAGYMSARKNGWLDEIMEPMLKPNGYWQNKENIIRAFKECNENIKEFRERYYCGYEIARKMGIMAELGYPERKPRNYWKDKDKVFEAARNSSGKKDFQKKYPSAYNAALIGGYWDEIVNKYFNNDSVYGYWTVKEHILDVAKECYGSADLKNRYPSAYVAACRYGWTKELKYKNRY